MIVHHCNRRLLWWATINFVSLIYGQQILFVSSTLDNMQDCRKYCTGTHLILVGQHGGGGGGVVVAEKQ
jgi:hypothetical protein